MKDFTIALAGKNIAITPIHPVLRKFCAEYLTEEKPDFSIAVTQDDIEFERAKSAREDEVEGIPIREFPDAYLESLAIYRKIAEKMLDYDTILFHGSANDDKPLLKIEEDRVLVCGTPWDGKHRISTNTMVPLKGLCILTRAPENTIRPISTMEAIPMLLQQSHRPSNPASVAKLLKLLEKMSKNTGLYCLGCNMDPEAAKVAYEGMNRKEEEL